MQTLDVAAGSGLRLLPAGHALLASAIRARSTTVTAVADGLGVSRKHLSNVLHGRASVSGGLLHALARAVGVSPELIQALATPSLEPRPVVEHGYARGLIVRHGDLTEPMEGWEIAED